MFTTHTVKSISKAYSTIITIVEDSEMGQKMTALYSYVATIVLLVLVVRLVSGPRIDITFNNNVSQRDRSLVTHDPAQKMGMIERENCKGLWFVPGKNNSCECGDELHGAVYCNNYTKSVSILDCYCMTNESTSHEMVVGHCILNCVNMSQNTDYLDLFYHTAPSQCDYLHRRGTLCGSCDHEHHFYYPAYSYDLECLKCIKPHSQWLYVVEAFFPLTLFILLILVFRISAVSPMLHAYVCLSQIFGAPIQVRIVLLSTKYTFHIFSAFTRILASLYGIWNLDFFRALLPGVCLHLTTMQVLSLDYLIAVYPMVLMVIAYIITELHTYGCRPLLFLWKPFHFVLARFRRTWDIQTSLIDTFATFFVLSSTKIFSVSFDLLTPTALYSVAGDEVGIYLYADPNIQYMKHSSGHLYYGLLAVIVLFVFTIFPLSLLMFSTCGFLKHLCRFKVVKDFLYTFQKYYKDGSGGTRDCRWYAAFHHLSLFGIYILYGFTRSEFSYILGPMYFITFAIVVLIVEPYKVEWAIHNSLDALLYIWEALFCVSITLLNFSSYLQRGYMLLGYISILFVSLSPLAFAVAFTLRWILKLVGCQVCKRSELQSSLPHRITNSEEYRYSISTALPSIPESIDSEQ